MAATSASLPFDEALGRLQRKLDEILVTRHDGPVQVLDAGCGAQRYVTFPVPAHVTGIDVSPEALSANEEIDESIVGDVQSYPLPREAFDVVVCWDVLEHLPRPRAALDNFLSSTRPGGILVLGVPYVFGAKGLIAKFTPHAVHVWVYRHILGHSRAGEPGAGPFKTYLRLAIAPDALRKFARERRLRLELMEFSRTPMTDTILERNRLARVVWQLVATVVRLGSLGRVDPNVTDVCVILRKAN